MKIEGTYAVLLASAGGVTLSLQWAQVLLFGVPPIVWFAALAGAIWGVINLQSESKASTPMVTFANTCVAVIASTAGAEYWKLSMSMHALIAMIVAAGPMFAFKWAQRRFFPERKQDV